MYPRKSWDRTGDPRVTNDPPDPGLPSLLARIQSPTRNHSGGEDRFADNSSLASRIAPPAREDGEIEPEGEGEDSFAASEKLQDAPKAPSVPTGNGVRIKTEETVPVISNPSPTRERPVGRQRGSRSTIDVVCMLHCVSYEQALIACSLVNRSFRTMTSKTLLGCSNVQAHWTAPTTMLWPRGHLLSTLLIPRLLPCCLSSSPSLPPGSQ